MDRIKNAFIYITFVITGLAVFQGLYAESPGFDCGNASNRAEIAICKTDNLARQDLKLNRLYKNVMEKLTEDMKAEVKAEQVAWLKKRNTFCNVADEKLEECLLNAYRERNSELSILMAFDSSARPAGNEALKILRITPKGENVPAGRQVVFQFDRPVVPIGRVERDAKDIPIEITPALNCEWRWLNTSALACQLKEEDMMRQATHYKIRVAPGIMTETGAGMKHEVLDEFTTPRPQVTYTRFVNWLSPGTPLIQVTFNQPVTRSSVEMIFSMTARNSVDDNPVSIVAWPDDMPRSLPYWLAITEQSEQPRVDDRKTEVQGGEARRIWLVEPVKELPRDATILLDVRPGLVSSEGPEKGIENRSIVSFETYPDFKFVGIRCRPEGARGNEDIPFRELAAFDLDQLQNNGCVPLSSVALVFSAPVLNSSVRKHVDFTPPLNGGRKDYDPWENTYDYTRLTAPHRSGRVYQIWLPERLQAYQKYTVSIDSKDFTDEFGRKLPADVKFAFFTSHREPNLVLAHPHAVLEKNVDTDVPLYVTNLYRVDVNYQSAGGSGSKKDVHETIKTAAAEDIAYAVPMGVRGLIGADTGVLYGTLHPEPPPPYWYRDPEIFVQVTPYQLHAKFGHFNSLIWVTNFAKGKPVSSATVTLYEGTYQDLAGMKAQGSSVKTDRNGMAELPGIMELDPDMQVLKYWHRNEDPRYFVKVEKNGDMALLPIDANFMVHSSGVYSRPQYKSGHTHAWGTTAQGVYKPGDTVEYKIYVRDQSNRHWVSPVKEGYKLSVYDPLRKVIHEEDGIILNEFGAFDGAIKLPEQGGVGWYSFTLTPAVPPGEKRPRFTWQPMRILVNDFTPAPFEVKTELNGERFSADDDVKVTALATLHAGGPFADGEVRLTARLSLNPFTVRNPLAKGFIFGSSNGKYLDKKQSNMLDIRGRLDDFGQYEDLFRLPENDIYYGSILVESAVKDDRGKFVAATAKAEYLGRDRYVGLRNTRWLYRKGKKSTLETLVVDGSGAPVAGVDVDVLIYNREYRASRVKGPGNAYLTQNVMEWVQESDCRVVTTSVVAECEFVPQNPGYYQFVATVKDTRGREHKTTINGWVRGAGSVVWDQTNDATLQIVSEQTDYRIGDIAHYLIKNPYPGARALVTVERYGILDRWIEKLDTSTPVIEVPIKPDYLPGFYLSVVVVSPRLDKPLSPEKVDLGKPGYRMGYVSAWVSDPYKQLDIDVTTNHVVYKPRDRVTAMLHVQPRGGGNHEPVELAVAVVDEAVLALNGSGEDYYDPYSGFNKLDALDVNNYSLISRLVGRQKFEKKGANPGGGGGSTYFQLRNLFKFVSYWNPSIIPDKDGNARIEFEIPDNLTGWRIMAFGVTPDDRMGLGHANFKVNRPTEIRPVMPNQVIEGDRFQAGFNVMNRTGAERDLNIKVEVDGPLVKESQNRFSFNINVPAYKRENIWLPVSTRGFGELIFTAHGGDNSDADAVEHKVPVNKRRSPETAATYGTTTAGEVRESVHIPEGIYTDVGEVGVVLTPSVIGNLDGAFRYVKDYAHLCWEQRLTKAVVANAYMQLKDYLKDDVEWPAPMEDVITNLQSAANFQAPNGGMTYWVSSNQYVSSYLSAYTAMAFNWLRRDGHAIPEAVEQRLHDYLLELLRRDEFPSFFSKGMASSVRAVALAALSEAGRIDQSDIDRYQTHVAEMDLFGKAHFLLAAINTGATADAVINPVMDNILGHASQTGGKFQFNEPWDDSYKYILATPLRSNCTVLSSLLSVQREGKAGAAIGDIPFKLVRSITQSLGNRDHWENTQENVFCLNAVIDYSKMYEATDPNMGVAVAFDGKALGRTRFEKKSAPSVKLSRPLDEDDPGKRATIEIKREGDGRLYYSARLAYDLKRDNASRINSGIEVRREYSVEREGKFMLLNSPVEIKRGELVRVDLFVSVPTARHFVTIYDPVPGGLEPVNTDLATTSVIDAEKGAFKAAEGSWWFHITDWSYYGRYFRSFYHKELRHDSARFYADYLPAGNYHLSYTAQAIAAGEFSIMPVQGEEMYDPDVYGKGLPATLRVGE